MIILTIVFWISFFIVFYTYVGYGVLLYLLVFIKEKINGRKVWESSWDKLPSMTLIVPAFNEEDIVDIKMKNCYSLKYPKEKLKIMWATDGSSDRTNEILSGYKNVVVSYSPDRKGKTAAMNNAMKLVDSEVVVFTDANTMLCEDALVNIGTMFGDSKVGCVAGEKRVASDEKDAASSSGEGAYWKYESKLKELDFRLYSAVGAAGELFAIRTCLYEPVSSDTLLDDFIISLKIVKRGYIIAYRSDAYAVESGSQDIANEKKRKVRIAAGGLQSIWRLRSMLNIFKYGIFSFQYISHRVLRWTITPILMFALLPLNIILVCMNGGVLYNCLLGAQILFYMLAFVGYVLRDVKVKQKSIFIPMFFIFMNINVFFAIPYLIKNRGNGAWEKSKRK